MNTAIKLIWQNVEILSRAAAHYFVKTCAESIAARDRFVVILSGGSTPKRLYELLPMPEYSRNINWKKVLLLWGDERFVPHTAYDSNYKMTKESLIDKIKIPKKNVFPIPVQGWPQDCASAYEKTVKTILCKGATPDLTLLGMGDDGHTASLFPYTNIITEDKKLVKEVWVDAEQAWRISLTYPLLNRSKNIMFLVTGESKAPVLKKIFSKRKLQKPYPVQGISPARGLTLWMLDEATGIQP